MCEASLVLSSPYGTNVPYLARTHTNPNGLRGKKFKRYRRERTIIPICDFFLADARTLKPICCSTSFLDGKEAHLQVATVVTNSVPGTDGGEVLTCLTL